MSLTRTTAGLILADDFTRADSSTLGGDWIEQAGDWAINSNRLRFVGGGFALVENDAGASGKAFVQIVTRISGTDRLTQLHARYEVPGTPSVHAGEGYALRRFDTATVMALLTGGARTNLQVASTTHAIDTDQPMQLYVADGVQEGWVNGVSASGTDTTHNGENLRTVSYSCDLGGGTTTVHGDDFVWCKCKNITVTGLSAGQ